jgi:hypothetical protein
MKNLENFFTNPFDDDKIPDERMNSFAHDHINRTTDNNPGGIYTAMITTTQTAYDGYFGHIVGESDSTSQRISKTASVKSLSKQIKSAISQQEGTIRGKWEVGSETYLEFFPSGVTEYYDATRDGIIPLLDRFIIAIGRHTDDLPENFVDQFRNLRSAYNTARNEQQKKKGDVSDEKAATEVSRVQLVNQLFLNLLTVAKDNAGNPAKLLSFFDQSIIRRKVKGVAKEGGEEPEELEPVTGEVEPGAVKEVMHGAFNVTTIFVLGNNGTDLVEFYTTNKPEDPKPGTTFPVQPGEEDEAGASKLGAVGNLYLMVYNPSDSVKGKYACEAYNL